MWEKILHSSWGFGVRLLICCSGHPISCQLYTLAECIRQDSRLRVTWDETVRVQLSTLLPWAQLILVCDKRRQPGETRDPLTRTSGTTKKAKANVARHEERKRLHGSIQGETSVSIYIFTLAVSRVLSAKVYSRHNTFCKVLPLSPKCSVSQY